MSYFIEKIQTLGCSTHKKTNLEYLSAACLFIAFSSIILFCSTCYFEYVLLFVIRFVDMKGREENSSPLLLSPKLRVKPLKRRRIRVGNADPDLDDSTLELLNAIRDIPSDVERSTRGLQPLPAIGSKKTDDIVFDICNSPKKELAVDVRLIDDALSQRKLTRNDGSKMVLRSRRRRETTFVSSKKNNLFANEEDIQQEALVTDRSDDSRVEFNDNCSVFSEFSEDLSKDRNYRRRNRKSDEIDNIEEEKSVIKSPIKAGRRSNRLTDPPIQHLSLQKSNNNKLSFHIDEDNLDILSSRDKTSLFEEDLISAFNGSNPPRGKSNSLSSEQSNKNEDSLTNKRRSRRFHRTMDEDASGGGGGENGFSDVGSVFSEDFSETYDPTFNYKQLKTNCISSILPNDDNGDGSVNGGIFTSPQRHKKRSRRHLTEGHYMWEENSAFSSESDFNNSKSFYLSDDNVDLSHQAHKLYPKQTRRRPHKYLPPLSENLSISK